MVTHPGSGEKPLNRMIKREQDKKNPVSFIRVSHFTGCWDRRTLVSRGIRELNGSPCIVDAMYLFKKEIYPLAIWTLSRYMSESVLNIGMIR